MNARQWFLTGALMLTTAAAPAPSAAQVLSDCDIARASFRAGGAEEVTNSAAFVTIPRTSVQFTQLLPGCVIADFTAESYAPKNARMIVRATIVGVGEGAPGPVMWTQDHDEDGNGKGFRVQGFRFVFPDVPIGLHTLRVQWRSGNDAEIRVRGRTVTVQHN